MAIYKVPGSRIEPYTVDTISVTCDCLNFFHVRKHCAIGDPRRLCKHLQKYKDEIMVQKGNDGKTRIRWQAAHQYYLQIKKDYIDQCREIVKYEACGSYRRLKDWVADIDFLLIMQGSSDVLYNHIASISEGHTVVAKGEKYMSILVKGTTFKVDFKVIPEESWVFGVLHYTGSASSNISLRAAASRKGWKLNEYGLYYKETGKPVRSLNTFVTEKDIFDILGEKYKAPQDR